VADWVLSDVHDDQHDDPAEDRWLLIYQVPAPEYAPDGTYSVSMPKGMLAEFAAAYGFDPGDPGDVQVAFDYLIHQPFMVEVARRGQAPFTGEGVMREVAANPLEMPAATARRLAEEHLAAFKRVHRVVSKAPAVRASGLTRPGAMVAVQALAAAPEVSMLDAVKADMIARVDPGRVRQAMEFAEAARARVQERVTARAAARAQAAAEAERIGQVRSGDAER